MIDLRQSIKYGKYMERIGWQTKKIGDCQIFIRKIPFFGSVIKTQRCASLKLDQLDKLAKSFHAFLLSVEPASEELVPELLKNGFRLSSDGMIPSKTRQIDLTPSEQTIFQSFNRTRKYKINKARRGGFQIKISCAVRRPNFEESFSDALRSNNASSLKERFDAAEICLSPSASATGTNLINDFISLWHKNALERGFWVPIKNQIKAMYEAFGEDAYVLMAYSKKSSAYTDRQPITGILLVLHNQIGSYFYAASSPIGRKLCAPSLLTWEAMKLAKSKGCIIFDFEGINDPRFPKKGWDGFSYFKESFGGKVVIFPGRYIKTYGLLSKFLFANSTPRKSV